MTMTYLNKFSLPIFCPSSDVNESIELNSLRIHGLWQGPISVWAVDAEQQGEDVLIKAPESVDQRFIWGKQPGVLVHYLQPRHRR